MLIFNTDPISQVDQTEQVAAAIKGGCGWIQLWLPDDDEESRSIAENVLNKCKQHDIILTIANNVDLVEDTKVHGIFLDTQNTPKAMEIRRQFGPHAIIGISSTSADEIKRLYSLADIDFIVISGTLNPESVKKLMAELSDRNIKQPVVMSYTNVPSAEQIADALNMGIRGIAVSLPGAQAEQIEQTIRETLETLNTI